MSSIYKNQNNFWNFMIMLPMPLGFIFLIGAIFYNLLFCIERSFPECLCRLYSFLHDLAVKLGMSAGLLNVLDKDPKTFLTVISTPILSVVLFIVYWKFYCSVNPSPSMKRKYVKFQAMYVAAKTSLRSSLSQSFEKLPIFPFSAPYDDAAEETYERINIRDSNSSSLEAIVNNALDKIRDELGGDDVYYMRGDLHEAVRNNNNSRALLIIEEVKQSGGELAIVAVVFSKRGRSVNVDIRNSAFPNTIHSKTPRRAVFAVQEHSHIYHDWSSYDRERYFLYFSPIGWTFRNDEFVPRFNQQTTAAAESLAGAVYGALKYNLEQ